MTFSFGSYCLMGVICSLLGLGFGRLCCLINNIENHWMQSGVGVVLTAAAAILLVASTKDHTGTDILTAVIFSSFMSLAYIAMTYLSN